MSRKINNSGGTKKQEIQAKKQRQGRQITIFAAVLGLFLVIGILAVLFFQSGAPVKMFSAVTIDGKGYKLSEFNYYYYAYYNSYLDEYSEFREYMFDDSVSLKDQPYDDNQSWFEYFEDQTVESMSSVLGTAALAEKEGFELSSEAQEEIDTALEGIESSADNAGMSTDKYLENIYGDGMTEKLYRKHLTYSHLAAEYSDKVKAGFGFSENEVKEYYQEHLAEYTFVNYERFYVKASDIDTDPTVEEKQNAYSIAQKICDKVEKGGDLKEVSSEFEDYGTYYAFDDAYYDPNFSYGEWLFAPERKDGDVNVIDDGSGYYVMVFHSRNESSYPTASIIDVCFSVDTALEDSSSDDYDNKVNQLYEDSCAKAEELLETWEKGDKTEDSFEALASENESASETDGTFENLTRDTLDDTIDKWVFDDGRKPGDCSVIYTESGFHVVYYAGTGAEAWQVKAEEDMRTDAYEKWYQNLLDTASVKRHSYVLGFAGGEINK